MCIDNIVTGNHSRQLLIMLVQGLLFILGLAWLVCCWVPCKPLF